MFPRFLMPEAMQKAGLLTINAWAIDGFTKVFWRDEPISHLWPQVLVLLGRAWYFSPSRADWRGGGSIRRQPRRLFFTRIVRRIHIVKLQRRHPMDLHHHFPGRHRIMVHVGIEIRETAGREGHHLGLIELVAMPTLKLPEITVTFSRLGCQCGAIL